MTDPQLLTGKVVAVTGAASGIGLAIALAAAKAGARAVVASDIVEQPREGGANVVERVTEAGAGCRFVMADVSRKVEVEAFVAAAEEFGGLDVMVCNAGIALTENFLDLTEADYRRILSVNLDGAFFTAQAAGRQMVARRRGGSIVMISSMGGLRGSAITPIYSTTKGGVRLMTASMADALGPYGVRVNAVCPGVIDTQLVRAADAADAIMGMKGRTPLRRIGRPEEVAAAVVWLASDRASFVTGAALPVDGGVSAIL
jgi:L-rhamnose 1-dehydrogenase